MYVGLWSRVEGFERDTLTRALERRSVVQGTLMRVTIHLVSARDYWPFAVAIRDGRLRTWLRLHPGRSKRDLALAARRVRRLVADGPKRQSEIEELLGKGGALGVGMLLDLLRAPPSGTWDRRRADLYVAAEDWLGKARVSRAEGVDLLVRRYLSGFGPAPRADVANWAGLPVGEISPALERLHLRRFRSERGDELFDLPRAPLPDPDTPSPVRFLPTWDATLLVHARRTGVLPEEYRPRVFSTKTPHSVSTFLVDGAVAGSWRYERGRVALKPFRRLDAGTRRELKNEADRLAAFHA